MEIYINDYDYEVEYDFDPDFWEDVLPNDVKEAIEEDVRSRVDIFEWAD